MQESSTSRYEENGLAFPQVLLARNLRGWPGLCVGHLLQHLKEC